MLLYSLCVSSLSGLKRVSDGGEVVAVHSHTHPTNSTQEYSSSSNPGWDISAGFKQLPSATSCEGNKRSLRCCCCCSYKKEVKSSLVCSIGYRHSDCLAYTKPVELLNSTVIFQENSTTVEIQGVVVSNSSQGAYQNNHFISFHFFFCNRRSNIGRDFKCWNIWDWKIM